MGLKPVCYFSAGSAEDWRPDFRQFPSAAIGRALDGWPGESWVDIRRADVSHRIVVLGHEPSDTGSPGPSDWWGWAEGHHRMRGRRPPPLTHSLTHSGAPKRTLQMTYKAA